MNKVPVTCKFLTIDWFGASTTVQLKYTCLVENGALNVIDDQKKNFSFRGTRTKPKYHVLLYVSKFCIIRRDYVEL